MKTYGLEMPSYSSLFLGDVDDVGVHNDMGELTHKENTFLLSGESLILRSNWTDIGMIITKEGPTILCDEGTSKLRTSSNGIQISKDGANWSGDLEPGKTSPSGTSILGYNGYMYASRVYNAIYVDIADFHALDDKLVYGKCYYDTKNGAKICNKRCQQSMIGMASDTYGFGIGTPKEENVPIAIGGWVLAYVDKEYDSGVVLTNDKNGNLTKMKWWEKLFHPERIVGIYHKKEKEETWGPKDARINVNNRHWIKVK